MRLKEVEAILRNEKYYRTFVQLHFSETSISNSEVQNNTHGNSKERQLVNKIEDKNYINAFRYIKAIEKLYDELDARERLIYVHRYKYNMSVERISFEVHYSKSTVWDDLKSIKEKFVKILNSEKL